MFVADPDQVPVLIRLGVGGGDRSEILFELPGEVEDARIVFDRSMIRFPAMPRAAHLTTPQFVHCLEQLLAWNRLLRGQHLLKFLEDEPRPPRHALSLRQRGDAAKLTFESGQWCFSCCYSKKFDTVRITEVESTELPWREWTALEEALQMFLKVIV